MALAPVRRLAVSARILTLATLLVGLQGCGHKSTDGGPSGASTPLPAAFVWPQFNDVPPVGALEILDAAGDQTLMPEGPPSVVPIPHTDITRMQLWRSGDWLFLRVDFAGDIPATASPVVQGENLVTSGVSVTMDSDHSYDTGAHNLNLVDQVALGVDLVFAIQVSYATNASPMGGAYVLYDIGAITDRFGGTAQGELRGGGPGTSYLCARWPLSAIPPKYWVVGTPALLMGSAETESTHYHHYAYDATLTKTWSLP